MMPEYRVMWEIELTATDPEAAARQALEIQRDPKSWANSFTVHDEYGYVSTQDFQSIDHGE